MGAWAPPALVELVWAESERLARLRDESSLVGRLRHAEADSVHVTCDRGRGGGEPNLDPNLAEIYWEITKLLEK